MMYHADVLHPAYRRVYRRDESRCYIALAPDQMQTLIHRCTRFKLSSVRCIVATPVMSPPARVARVATG